MTEAFSKLAKKRQSAPATKAKRDPSSGLFEPSSPLNDPAMLEQAIRWVRAVDELRPVLLVFADDADLKMVGACGVTLAVLDTLKQSMLDAMAVDKEAVRDATKPLLRAARRRPLGGPV